MFQRHERRVQGAVLFQQFVRIQADDFRVPGHHRTVVAVRGVFALPALARQAGEKDALEALAQERGDVPVRELGGVADRLRGHGRQAEIEKLLARRRGQLHAVAQFREQREPERVMLVHIEYAGDADAPARGVVLREPVRIRTGGVPSMRTGWAWTGRAASPPEAPRSQRLPDTSFLPLEKRLTVSRQWLPHPLQRRVLAEISRERREADVRGVGTAPSACGCGRAGPRRRPP